MNHAAHRALRVQINVALGRNEIPTAVSMHQAPSVLRAIVGVLLAERTRLGTAASEPQRTDQQPRSEEKAAQTEARPVESQLKPTHEALDCKDESEPQWQENGKKDASVEKLRQENQLLAESLREQSSESTRLLLQLNSVRRQIAEQDGARVAAVNAALELVRKLHADACSHVPTQHGAALASSSAVRRATRSMADPVDASLAALVEELTCFTTEFSTYRSQVRLLASLPSVHGLPNPFVLAPGRGCGSSLGCERSPGTLG
jgi:hypothetical protein